MLVLKVKYGSQTRRLTFPDRVTWETVRAQICTALRISRLDDYRVLYEDDEKDRVIITHDADFQEALHVVSEAEAMVTSSASSSSSPLATSSTPLKVFVVPRSGRRNPSRTLRSPPRSASTSSLSASAASSSSSSTMPRRGRRLTRGIGGRTVQRSHRHRSATASPASSSSSSSSPAPRRRVAVGDDVALSDTLNPASRVSREVLEKRSESQATDQKSADKVALSEVDTVCNQGWWSRATHSGKERSSSEGVPVPSSCGEVKLCMPENAATTAADSALAAACSPSFSPLPAVADGGASASVEPAAATTNTSASSSRLPMFPFALTRALPPCGADSQTKANEVDHDDRDFAERFDFDHGVGVVQGRALNQQIESYSVGSLSSTPQASSASVSQSVIPAPLPSLITNDLISKISSSPVGSLPTLANDFDVAKQLKDKASQTEISDLNAQLMFAHEREAASDEKSPGTPAAAADAGAGAGQSQVDVHALSTHVTDSVLRALRSQMSELTVSAMATVNHHSVPTTEQKSCAEMDFDKLASVVAERVLRELRCPPPAADESVVVACLEPAEPGLHSRNDANAAAAGSGRSERDGDRDLAQAASQQPAVATATAVAVVDLEAQSRAQERLLVTHRALEESMLQLTEKMHGLHERVDSIPFERLRALNISTHEGVAVEEERGPDGSLSDSSTRTSNEAPLLGETPRCAPPASAAAADDDDESATSEDEDEGENAASSSRRGDGLGGADGSSESAHSPSSVAAACVSQALVSQEGGSMFSKVAQKSRTNSEDLTQTTISKSDGVRERRSSSAATATTPSAAEVSSEIASAQSPASFVAEFQSALSSQSKNDAAADDTTRSVSVDVCLSSSSSAADGGSSGGGNREGSGDSDAAAAAAAAAAISSVWANMPPVGGSSSVSEAEASPKSIGAQPRSPYASAAQVDAQPPKPKQESDDEMLASVSLDSDGGGGGGGGISSSSSSRGDGDAAARMFRSAYDLMTNEQGDDPSLQEKIDYLEQRFGNRVFCAVILNQSKGDVDEAEESLRAFYKK